MSMNFITPPANQDYDPYATAKTNSTTNRNLKNTSTTSTSTVNQPVKYGAIDISKWAYDPNQGLVWGVGDNPQTDFVLLPNNSDRNTMLLNANGDPLTVNEYVQQYIAEKLKTKDGIASLRDKFAANGLLQGSELAQSRADSASDPNFPDQILQSKIANAARVTSAQNYYSAQTGKSLQTPDEVINSTKIKIASAGGGGGAPSHSVQTNRQVFNPDDYRKSVDAIYQEITGKGADEKTLDKIIANLNAKEKANPQKSVTNRHGNNTSTTTSGGMTADAIASEIEQTALNDPEAEDYNKATKFMDYFMNSLGSQIDLGA